MSATRCPAMKQSASLAHELKRTLARLRRLVLYCRGCERQEDCEMARLIEDAAAQAAQEVLDELGS